MNPPDRTEFLNQVDDCVHRLMMLHAQARLFEDVEHSAMDKATLQLTMSHLSLIRAVDKS